MFLKDSGHGITKESLRFWLENRNKIGVITCLEASYEPLFVEQVQASAGFTYPLEYNVIVSGSNGAIILSGCNCGYGGEGPNGTAQILAELGLPIEKARVITYQKRFEYNIINRKITYFAEGVKKI